MEDFEKLYLSHYPIVYGYLLRLCGDAHLAEEVTQEAFFRAMRSLKSYRGECRFSAWVCQIAKHELFREMKRRKRTLPPDSLAAYADPETDVESHTEDQDTAERIRAQMEVLEEPYQSVFRMRVLEELPFAEIAARYGKSESWARVTYHRAKLRIQEGLR
ncbi:MAG: sigma-70 family RNA polymerase sigma factor [Oscillospiraceae bacterium]|nr:sigma-70 family RNA polymerase sigma factor [Oscillospiraceae bacterium]